MNDLIRLLTRLTLLVAGAVFFVSLLLAGMVVAAAFTIWSLLRGRRPTLQDVFRFQRGRPSPFGASPFRTAPIDSGDVVEVQAREVMRADARVSQG